MKGFETHEQGSKSFGKVVVVELGHISLHSNICQQASVVCSAHSRSRF